MKASEMMTSDWVMPLQKRFRSIPGQIVTIDGGTDICWIDCDNYSCLIPCGDVEGIPITPEILEKNGFIYNELPFVQGWEQFGLTLTIGGNGFRINCGTNVAMIIDSVHELQHALRLCGVHKDIVL